MEPFILAFIVSILGTVVGSFIAVIIKKPSKKLMGSILGVATGIMISIIFLELIPEAVQYNGFLRTLLIIIVGISAIAIADILSKNSNLQKNTHLKVAFLMSLAMMLHNFPEGLIMGFSFLEKNSLGLKMAMLISIHDIPEGLAVATPLVVSGMNPLKILWYGFLVAFPTAVGSWIGIILGSISNMVLGISIAFASGVMIYVVFGQMLPESNSLTDSTTVSISTILGVIIGFIMLNTI